MTSTPIDVVSSSAPTPMSDLSLRRIAEMLLSAGTTSAVLPSTALFNDGWMLRLALDFFARHAPSGHPLDLLPNATWRSEALLRSQFEALSRGDILAESMTNADGVIGHLTAGAGRGDVLPSAHATQFVVVEAKMWSGLSAGTTRAKTFNQAARNVACIAEAFARSACDRRNATRFGFVLLAPDQQITDRVFFDWCDKTHIETVVRARVTAFAGRRDAPQKDAWLVDHFLPALAALQAPRTCVGSRCWRTLRSARPKKGRRFPTSARAALRSTARPDAPPRSRSTGMGLSRSRSSPCDAMRCDAMRACASPRLRDAESHHTCRPS